ncbi:hypothetical protein CBL_11063 [Carabus blaptoides fortunei]
MLACSPADMDAAPEATLNWRDSGNVWTALMNVSGNANTQICVRHSVCRLAQSASEVFMLVFCIGGYMKTIGQDVKYIRFLTSHSTLHVTREYSRQHTDAKIYYVHEVIIRVVFLPQSSIYVVETPSISVNKPESRPVRNKGKKDWWCGHISDAEGTSGRHVGIHTPSTRSRTTESS